MLLHGEPGEIELVADPLDDPKDWYVEQYGGGVMIVEPRTFGSLFVPNPQEYEDLEFVSRRES